MTLDIYLSGPIQILLDFTAKDGRVRPINKAPP
jgi:hypothetical protein